MLTPEFEAKLQDLIAEVATPDDPAHDLLHFKRVVKLAKQICGQEGARAEVVVPAAWLHDLVIIPKNDPRRAMASRLSAERATEVLRGLGYPEAHLADVAHAIEAHSFSANIETRTLEAKIVQDADRLDGLGAIGIARCFATAGLLRRAFYEESDPFARARAVDDRLYTIDHFYAKLFKTVQTLKTEAGRREGQRRLGVMERFLADLKMEIQ